MKDPGNIVNASNFHSAHQLVIVVEMRSSARSFRPIENAILDAIRRGRPFDGLTP